MGGSNRDFSELLGTADLAPYVSTATWSTVKQAFPGELFDRWLEGLETLIAAECSQGIVLGLIRASPECAKAIGAVATLELAPAALSLFQTNGPSIAETMLSQAPRAVGYLKDAASFLSWLSTLRELAFSAPESVKLVCESCDRLLPHLGAVGFRAWVVAGLSVSGGDAAKRVRYFSLSDVAAIQVLEQESSNVHLSFMERRLQAYLLALWRIHPVIRPATAKKALHVPRRSTFDQYLIRMPESFAGFQASEAERLFKAAAAHIGAHMVFTLEKFSLKALKPLQVALVSIVEDARVERLAGEQYPGLLRRWRSFHTAAADGPNLAGPLLARLSRALIDDDYIDGNPWIEKGRKIFGEARGQWDDPNAIRQIGVLLGNDLGQMRVQFNPKTYIVQPPYRDDNLGIWDMGDPAQEAADDPDIIYDSVQLQQTEDLEEPHQRERDEAECDEANRAATIQLKDEDLGIPIARYAEWDHVSGRERPEWTTIMEHLPRSSPPEIIDHIIAQHADIKHRINSLISQARVSRPTRVRRQPEGDRLDLEACIRAVIDRQAGLSPETRVYESSVRLHRDLSILVLIDISESTKDQIKGTTTSVFSIERAATSLLSHAMSEVGDPFAVHAFCSDGRSDVRYYKIKDFDQNYGAEQKGNLAGLKPGLSTRLGAALRHAGSEIARQVNHRRLVLVVTDGEPSDVDVEDPKYLVEDTRKAVQELAHQAIDVFCVCLDGGGDDYLSRIFGRRNVMQIDKITSLPEKLPMLYFRLIA